MRVFVTGATGFIGSAIVQELINAGHQVVGLARSDEAAKLLAAAGAEVHRGSLDDLDSLKRGAAASDGVIHTAFIHDFSNFEASCKADKLAIETIGAALEGSGRPFVISSGTLSLKDGRLATEEDGPDLNSAGVLRAASEVAALSMASKGVRVSSMRLPPSVHGNGDHGFVPRLITIAREKAVSSYVGEGLGRWPAVHRLDAARLFRLALEKGSAGAKYHAVADEGVPVREIAEVIGRHLNVPVAAKSFEEAMKQFGWLAHGLARDNPTSSKRTQEELGWHPSEPGLIADLEQGHYFETQHEKPAASLR
ncbi:NAD dependent epimerase/dehydratase [Glonium stellatum]|uniref:NAD dependent epimerase/dehydratase n=1 Tax=Glonium stellatum TaxID=574774 RepID=A0A8E2JRA9_9PEZI|nr:NAD dependent epimerase/dehydratase [Glonium stellatum]